MLMPMSGTETTPWVWVIVVLRRASQFRRRTRILEENIGDAPTTRYSKFFMWLDQPLPSEDYKNLMYQMHLAMVGMADRNAQLEQVNVDQNRRLMLMMKLMFIMVMLSALMLEIGIVLLVKLYGVRKLES
ncbi:unnamed protein product [Lactuca saligna]|uniref:Uncharacterized protein n=1 Tax=Lactuca saligna TaxID=75948 RepID=A0AA35V2S7_LACSI|nr:unnamed protein product [Lactuca saligna]